MYRRAGCWLSKSTQCGRRVGAEIHLQLHSQVPEGKLCPPGGRGSFSNLQKRLHILTSHGPVGLHVPREECLSLIPTKVKYVHTAHSLAQFSYSRDAPIRIGESGSGNTTLPWKDRARQPQVQRDMNTGGAATRRNTLPPLCFLCAPLSRPLPALPLGLG